jgi:hypothetical protein
MKEVIIPAASQEDANWIAKICQEQIASPERRISPCSQGIPLDSLRKANSAKVVDTELLHPLPRQNAA